AGRARTVADLLQVALARGGAAHRAVRLDGVGGTRVTRAGTGLRDVAGAGGRPAGRARGPELARARAARCWEAVVCAVVAGLAVAAVEHPVAAEARDRHGDEVPVVGLRAVAGAGIVAGGLAAVGDRVAETDGALVAAGEREAAVVAATARAPREPQRVGD